MLGKISHKKCKTPIKGAHWYEGKDVGEGVLISIDKES
jgi:hypothetical protein